jgi:hypothetical protein
LNDEAQQLMARAWPVLRAAQQQKVRAWSAWPELGAAQQEAPEEPEDGATQQDNPEEPDIEDETDNQSQVTYRLVQY